MWSQSVSNDRLRASQTAASFSQLSNEILISGNRIRSHQHLPIFAVSGLANDVVYTLEDVSQCISNRIIFNLWRFLTFHNNHILHDAGSRPHEVPIFFLKLHLLFIKGI